MDLADQLALSDDEDESKESEAVITVGADEVINKTGVPGITLSELPAQFHIDYDSEDERFDSEDDEYVDCEDDLGSAIFNLGNYCHQMLQGRRCCKARCSWIHYMAPDDAVTQFHRISANLPLAAVLRFYTFFTDLEVQTEAVSEAQQQLDRSCPGERVEVEPSIVVRRVFTAMVAASADLALDLDHYLTLVDTSAGVGGVADPAIRATLATLFGRAVQALAASSNPARAGRRLALWGWSLYLDSIGAGVVLPSTLYPVLCSLLGDEGRRAEQAELLLYTALLPTLAPPLPAIASLLAWPGLPAAPATAFLTSQVLARLPAQDWHGLAAALPDLGPALARLVTGLAAQPPAQLHRFYESLPEISGLVVPESAPSPPSSLEAWLAGKLSGGRWAEMATEFCRVSAREPELLEEWTTALLLELSRLCGEFRLQAPLSAVVGVLVEAVLPLQSQLHSLYTAQLGVALLLCQVTAGQWDEARALLSLLSSRLRVDFLTIKPPGLGQFAEVEAGLVPLFVLEVLVVTRQRHELQLRLAAWDCLAGLQSPLSREKRDKLLLAALERLAEGEAGPDTISLMVRASEVLGPAMREEQQPATRRRHEIMANIIFQLMLNDSQTSGEALWSRYQASRVAKHKLDRLVTRGLVCSLARLRLTQQATRVYRSAVQWDSYSRQANTRPLNIRLTSDLTMEEIFVIVTDFLARLNTTANMNEKLNIFIKMEETHTPNTGIKLLNCIRSSKKDAMERVEKVLVPPMKLSKAALPYIPDLLVRAHLAGGHHTL